jgi:DNA-binding HxlR family transcriptional regulator
VVAKVKTRDAKRRAYLRRVAVVFKDDIRIKIVNELFQREMSPKEFYEEVAGTSISRVDQHFKDLAKHGWLRHVRSEGPDSRRRGSVEHFYRATELAILDNETWALVPYSVRSFMGWRTFKTLAEGVGKALEARTLNARPESHMNCTTMNLDELGWETVVGAVDALLDSIFEEQADSRLRVFRSGERPLGAMVALAAFESPARPPMAAAPRTTPELVEVLEKPQAPFAERVFKVFADELSRTILMEANERKISAPLFHREIGGDSIEVIRRRFKALEKAGWLRLVEERTGGRRRSAHERFYRATGPTISEQESWAVVPRSIQPSAGWQTFRRFADLVKEAFDGGTFDARLDRHLSWSVLWLDRQGWENIAREVGELLSFILKEKDKAEARLRRSGQSPISTTVGLAAFESPKGASKEREGSD